jgi:CheY-like chemotaxis protein
MSYRVMVVDDDGNTRHALGALLEMEGYAVDVCADAGSALNALRARAYRALVTDYVMPKMDGLMLVREARALQPAIRCYVLTGRPRPEGELEDTVWLGKPIQLDALLKLLYTDGAAATTGSRSLPLTAG